MKRQFRLVIELDNDAFTGNEDNEVARILRRLATNIEELGLPMTHARTLRDSAGQNVGHAYGTEDYRNTPDR